MWYAENREKALRGLSFEITDVCYDNLNWFNFEIKINDSVFEFTECESAESFTELYAVHKDIKAYVGTIETMETMLFRIEGFVFSLGDVYRYFYYHAEASAEDIYNNSVIIGKAEAAHDRSCVIDMFKR